MRQRFTKATLIGFTRSLRAGALIFGLLAVVPAARADDASKILKSMSEYVTSQKAISAAFDSDIEVVTPDLQKIQFNSSGRLLLSRPDKMLVSRTGGYTDVELMFDGKQLSLAGKNANVFMQADFSGSIDQAIDHLYSKFDAMLPGMDLLTTNSDKELMTDVVDLRHIGRGVVDGVECEHLAARGTEVDWQIWIETGAQPVPRKYVITSKTMAAAPQYTLKIRDWKTDVKVADDAFVFKPQKDASKVAFESLIEFDEVPSGTTVGVKK
jgi:hypothetical protein